MTDHPLRPWAAVASIAAGTFVLVTTEFLPIGLLSRIAGDLHVSDGTAGLSVTAPGLVATVAAPALVIAARRIDRRIVIVLLTLAITVSCLIGALATNFTMFLVGRLVLGLAVGGLWSFAVAVGRRLVPESDGARATSVISAGISAGTIFGMPVGAVLGDWVGWRWVFAANALLSLIAVLVQLRFLPRLATTVAIEVGQLIAFARVRMAAIGLVAASCVAGGHFIAYTYLEPFLRGTLMLRQVGVASMLAGYAVAGMIGAFAGEHLAVLHVRRAFIVASFLLALSIAGTVALAGTHSAAVALVMVWGVAFGAVPVCVQIWMYQSSPRLYEAGSALMVSAFQIALASGAAIGGFLVDTHGISAAFVASGIACLIGTLIVATARFTSLPPTGEA